MKKLITIFIILLCIVSTSPIYAKEETETNIINATTEIIYNHEAGLLEVTNIIIPCNGAYYGIVVNDGVNYSNKNNYFTTASGLTIMITNEELKAGINKDNGITSIQELENGVFLVVKGNDEETVLSVYNGVFKATESAFQMFYHDIAKEWTDEVIITNDVVSFSNGEDIIYVYQNPGSTSSWGYKELEPTVFYKELNSIDIPITYSEDQNSYKGNKSYGYYVPNLAYEKYEPYKVNDYIPYSAFDENTGYIILAKSHDLLRSLFNSRNEYLQELGTIYLTKSNTEVVNLNTNSYDLSNVKEYAKKVINSDNRWHFELYVRQRDSRGIITGATQREMMLENNFYYPIEMQELIDLAKQENGLQSINTCSFWEDDTNQHSYSIYSAVYVFPTVNSKIYGDPLGSYMPREQAREHGSNHLNKQAGPYYNYPSKSYGFNNEWSFHQYAAKGNYVYKYTYEKTLIIERINYEHRPQEVQLYGPLYLPTVYTSSGESASCESVTGHNYGYGLIFNRIAEIMY